MPDKIMTLLAEVTGGKSYKAHKYGLDQAERPFIDYGEDSIIWEKTAETYRHRKYVPLEKLSKTLSLRNEQLLTFFLDGSRRVFKVDDIAYLQSGGRSVILDLCQYFGQKKLKDYAVFPSSSSSFCWGVR